MRYAVLGDIHANLTALEAVLEAVDRVDVDAVLSVGDVVGYGAKPKEVVGLLREIGAEVVKGNHDAAVVGELDTRLFNPLAKDAAEWTRKSLGREDRSWLRKLPLVKELEHCSLAHGTFAHPERFAYVQTTEDADPSLDSMGSSVCFVGHTHVPVAIMRLKDTPRTGYTVAQQVDLSEADRALINVGSVGQPRDEDHRAAWALFDPEGETYELFRVDYDVDREAALIREAGLPSMLADRLFLGV